MAAVAFSSHSSETLRERQRHRALTESQHRFWDACACVEVVAASSIGC
ncbi:MAG: hypothetical protein PUP93_11335 [Rhizonema sp. NSF051]|nr:hypothetical protein [Rhizonema sp. NSF051]